jgi:type VI secretion system Hcp family effector
MSSTTIYVKFTTPSAGAGAIVGEVNAKGFEGTILVHATTLSVAQTLSIGSASAGAGAGKVTFNKANFTKDLDATTPVLFQALAAGAHWDFVDFLFTTADKTGKTSTYATCRLKFVALASLDWSAEQDVPAENVGLEYGAMIWSVATPSGGTKIGGWNRVLNKTDTNVNTAING